MTRDDEFIGQIEGYLDEYEGMTPLPAAVRAAVRAQLPTTKQLGGFPKPMRFLTMNRPLQITLAAVAALAVGLAALSALNPRIGSEPTPTEYPTVDLGIFEPVAGRIVYGDGGGIWGVDPAAPADPARRIENVEAGSPLGWSSDGTRLLIERSGPQGGSDLFVLHTDGSETRLTERPRDLRHATISPDGSRVVFAECTGTLDQDRCALYAVDADGGSAEMLHEAGFVEGLTFSPDGTQIAYVIGRGDSDHGVWVVDSDGSGAHEILANDTTLGGGHVRGLHPLAWSPAGDRIALALELVIYTFASDGSGFTRVIGGDQPYWSPDGSQLAVSVGGVLCIIDADGSNILCPGSGDSGPWHPGRPETEAPSPTEDPSVFGIFEPVAGWIVYGDENGIWGVDPAAPADPATRIENVEAGSPLGWSSDGTRLLIMRGRTGEEGVFILHADGSETQLTGVPGGTDFAAISPDWSRVVFAGATSSGGSAVYAVDAAGGPAEMLREAAVADLAFSPDGTQIAYIEWGGGDHGHNVWLMDADGSDAHQIVSSEVVDGHVRGHALAWSPTGDRIALALEGAIYTFAPDGSGLTRVISGGDQPYWSPDGSQLASAFEGSPPAVGPRAFSRPKVYLQITDADGSNLLRFGFGTSGPWHPGRPENGAGG